MLKARIIKQRRDLSVRVEFALEQGASLGLFGASGAGKSTVLACIAGIEEPDEGEVRLGGLQLFPPSLPLYRRPLGYLTQEPNLFPHLTVCDNVMFGVNGGANGAHGAFVEKERSAMSSQQTAAWIAELRERLQLGPLWDAPASRISGGQARRVALARTLARRPPLLLLDEPFAGLDRQLVRELIDDLIFWSQHLGFSMIAVDHQAEVLRRLCPQQVLALEGGAVVQQGPWDELYGTPATPLLQSLLAPL